MAVEESPGRQGIAACGLAHVAKLRTLSRKRQNESWPSTNLRGDKRTVRSAAEKPRRRGPRKLVVLRGGAYNNAVTMRERVDPESSKGVVAFSKPGA
jgi:hypothetical protein